MSTPNIVIFSSDMGVSARLLDVAGFVQADAEVIAQAEDAALPTHALAIIHLGHQDHLSAVTRYRQRFPRRTLLALVADELLQSEPNLVTQMAQLGVSQFLPATTPDDVIATHVGFCLAQDAGRGSRSTTTRHSPSTNVVQLRQKLADTKQELAAESLLASISREFIESVPDLNRVCEMIGEAFGADRVGLYRAWEASGYGLAAGWRRASDVLASAANPSSINSISNETLPWISGQLREGGSIVAASLAEFPPEAASDRRYFESQNIGAICLIPTLELASKVAGVIAISRSAGEDEFDPTLIDMVHVVSDILAHYWERQDVEKRLHLTHFSVDHASDAVFWLRPDGRVHFANQAATRMLRLPLPKLLTLDATHIGLIPQTTPNTAWPNFLAQLRTQRSLRHESQLKTSFDYKIPVEISFDLLTLLNEEFICAFVRDARDRHQHEQRMQWRLQIERVMLDVTRMLFVGRDVDLKQAIERIGGAFGVHRANVFRYHSNESGELTDVQLWQWVDRDHAQPRERLLSRSPERFNWWRGQLDTGRAFAVRDTSEIPAEAERTTILAAGARSLVACAVVGSDGARLGVISLADTRQPRDWSQADLDALELIAGVLGVYWQRGSSSEVIELQGQIIHRLPMAVMVLDTKGYITYWNPSAASLYGMGAEQAIGAHVSVLFPLETHAQLYETVIQPLLMGGRHELEARQLHRNGDEFEAALSLSLLTDSLCNPTGVICFSNNIGERKHFEETMRRSEALLKGNLDCTRDAIVTIDDEGIIETFNETASRMFQILPQEVIGKPVAQFLPAQYGEAFEQAFEVFRRTGNVPLLGDVREFSAQRRDETPFPVEVLVQESRLGRRRLFTCSIRDISERRVLEDRLAQAQRLETIGTLTSGVSLDLNNLLAPIIGYAQLLEGEVAETGRGREFLNHVREAADRAKKLVEKMIAFSRKSSPKRRRVSLNSIVTKAASMVRETSRNNIEVTSTVPKGSLELDGDPSQLQQTVISLVGYCVQSMGAEGGTIHVELTSLDLVNEGYAASLQLEPGRYAQINVVDDGPGIPSHMLPYLFDPLYTGRGHGRESGLMLSSVQGMVSRHNGRIFVRSDVGQGVRFEVIIPLDSRERSDAKSTEKLASHLGDHTPTAFREHRSGSSTDKPTGPISPGEVVIVDDEQLVAETTSDMAQSLGYSTAVFIDPEMALEAIEAVPQAPSMMICDYSMPKMTGVQLALAVRQKCPDLPIVMVTGVTDEVPKEGLRQAGVAELVPKPFSLARLREVLDSNAKGARKT